MEAQELFDSFVENGVERARQVDPRGVLLTVRDIVQVRSRGRVGFGPDEMVASNTHSLVPFEHSPGEKLAWWRLEEGHYVVHFNETLKAGAPPCVLLPCAELVDTGCILVPALFAEGPLRAPLVVPKSGVSIKETGCIAALAPVG